MLTLESAGRGCWSTLQIWNGCSKSSTMVNGSEQMFFKDKGWYCSVRTSLGFYRNKRQGKTTSSGHRSPSPSTAFHIFNLRSAYISVYFQPISELHFKCQDAIQRPTFSTRNVIALEDICTTGQMKLQVTSTCIICFLPLSFPTAP